MTHDSDLPSSFKGQVPLFPLQNVVLLPHAVVPLHIFEPRYRTMTQDVLSGDQLLGMALLRPNRPETAEVYPVVGLGRIVAHQRHLDGRYHILLRGIGRAVLECDIPTDKPYRIGKVSLLEDILPNRSADEIAQSVEETLAKLGDAFPELLLNSVLGELRAERENLSLISDVIASALPISIEATQNLLAEPDVSLRWRLLRDYVDYLVTSRHRQKKREFPPRFSRN